VERLRRGKAQDRERPALVSIAAASKRLNLAFPTVTASLKRLEQPGHPARDHWQQEWLKLCCCWFARVPQMRHGHGMTAPVRLDRSNRIVLSRDLRRAAGIPQGQKLKVSATPGRVVLEVEANPGKVVRRGKIEMWTGPVPSTPIEEAVGVVRHYER
jgi:hypothetical protein